MKVFAACIVLRSSGVAKENPKHVLLAWVALVPILAQCAPALESFHLPAQPACVMLPMPHGCCQPPHAEFMLSHDPRLEGQNLCIQQ